MKANAPTGNTGEDNTGNRNSGYRNSGDRNSGDRNSGNRNSGNRNSGDRNSGYLNSGYLNSGDRNSGNRNSGDRNSGYLNSDKPTVRIFNKDTGIARDDFDVSFPSFFSSGYMPTKWVGESDMTEQEKKDNPLYNIAGGYLKKNIQKTYNKELAKEEMQKAWRASRNKADDEDRRKVYTIPNWDNAIFLEISGIDVDKELNMPKGLSGKTIKVEVDGVSYEAVIK